MEPTEFNACVDQLRMAFRSFMERSLLNSPREQPLYHFTDTKGLIGILQTNNLWVSLATELNDPSELGYGVLLALDLAHNQKVQAPESFLRDVFYFLEPANSPDPIRVELRPFVASFCGEADRSVHWLHYGKSGRGVAIAFDPTRIRGNYDLFPLVYAPEVQQSLVRAMLEHMWMATQGLLQPSWSKRDREAFSRAAAHVTATYFPTVSARIKHPAFQNESEWRLQIFDAYGGGLREGVGQDWPMRFRDVGGRVVPYYELQFEPESILGLTLGYSFPSHPGSHGLRMLLRDRPSIEIRRSEIPARS